MNTSAAVYLLECSVQSQAQSNNDDGLSLNYVLEEQSLWNSVNDIVNCKGVCSHDDDADAGSTEPGDIVGGG